MAQESPELEGPLDNPDWTAEENREVDKAMDRTTPQLARAEVIGEQLPLTVEEDTEESEDVERYSKPKSRSSRPVHGAHQLRIKDDTKSSTDQNDRLVEQSQILREPTQEAPPDAVRAAKEMIDGPTQRRLEEAANIPPDHQFDDK